MGVEDRGGWDGVEASTAQCSLFELLHRDQVPWGADALVAAGLMWEGRQGTARRDLPMTGRVVKVCSMSANVHELYTVCGAPCSHVSHTPKLKPQPPPVVSLSHIVTLLCAFHANAPPPAPRSSMRDEKQLEERLAVKVPRIHVVPGSNKLNHLAKTEAFKVQVVT